MNEVLRRMHVGSACRVFIAGLAMAAGLLFAMPGEAQDSRPVPGESRPSTSLPSNIPVKREQTGGGATSDDLRWVAIVLAMGLIAAAVLVARQRARPARSAASARVTTGPWWRQLGGLLDTVPSHEIQRVSSMPLSPRHSLHVVVWNGRRLLLGCTDQSIQLLAEAPTPADAAQREAATKEAHP